MPKPHVIPRALLRSAGLIDVRAEGRPISDQEAKQTVAGLVKAFDEFKAKHESRYAAIEEEMNRNALHAAARELNGGGDPGFNGMPADPEYRKTFASYTRRGAGDAEAALQAANATGDRASIMAAMSEGDNSAGGYLAPVEWDRKIQKAQRALSPMRRICRVVTTARAAYSTLWSSDQWGSGWVGETASRPATATTTLTPLIFPAGEIYANPAVTQRLLDDAAIDFDGWLSDNLGDEFNRQEGVAFIGGDGINKPCGLLQYAEGGAQAAAHPGGAVKVTVSGNATSIPTPDVLVDLKYALPAPYRQNAVWLMNSTTAALLTKMKDADGRFIWRESLATDQPPTLLGSPVEIDENMPNVGAAVNGVAALPIAYGDFARGYLINDRVGVRILRDPYTNKPFVSFYATKRVGGGLLDPAAIRLLKIATA